MPKPKGERLDQQRMGLFREMEYITIGDRYPGARQKPFKPAPKVKRLEVPFTKEKSGLQDGFFAQKYGRIMEHEAYHDPVAARRAHRVKEMKKNLASAFVPSSPTKKPAGTGSYYGTLGGKVSHFSAQVKPKKSQGAEKRNFYTAPPQKGTGFGYTGVCLDKFPRHKPDPLDMQEKMRRQLASVHREKLKARGAVYNTSCAPMDQFDANPNKVTNPGPVYREEKKMQVKAEPFKPSNPAKDPGGCKAGMFDKFPVHMKEPYQKPPVTRDLTSKIRPKNCPLVFQPVTDMKSTRTRSILDQNVTKCINVVTFTQGAAILEASAPPKEAPGLPKVQC